MHVQILTTLGNPLRVQWLGRHTFNAGYTSLIPIRRTKSPHATHKKKRERFLFNVFDATIFMHLSIIHSKCLSCRDTKIMLLLKKKNVTSPCPKFYWALSSVHSYSFMCIHIPSTIFESNYWLEKAPGFRSKCRACKYCDNVTHPIWSLHPALVRKCLRYVICLIHMFKHCL